MAERKINGKLYKTEPMLAEDALVMQMRLMSVIGGAIDRLPVILMGAGTTATPEAREMASAAATAAFAEIFTKKDPMIMMALIRDIVSLAQIRRPSGAYDQVDLNGEFTGNLAEIIPVATFVLQEQFGSFFTGLQALGSQRPKPRA